MIPTEIELVKAHLEDLVSKLKPDIVVWLSTAFPRLTAADRDDLAEKVARSSAQEAIRSSYESLREYLTTPR